MRSLSVLSRPLGTLAAMVGAVLLSGSLVGCGNSVDAPATYKTTGTVTLDGAPVAGATVTFAPRQRDEGVKEAYAITGDDGTYNLETNIPGSGKVEGAVPGTHRVTVSKVENPETKDQGSGDYYSGDYVPAGVMGGNPNEKAEGPTYLVPEKYSAPGTSGLTADVTTEGPNTFDFALTSSE